MVSRLTLNLFDFYFIIIVKAKYGDVAVNESDSSSEEEDDDAEVTCFFVLFSLLSNSPKVVLEV